MSRTTINDAKSISGLLLLLSYFTYTVDRTERESALIAIEKELLPFSPEACEALNAAIQKRRVVWQKAAV